ncbi:MAG: YHS domain-containing (seleno)protein [Cyclobacteriaceae bacterium]
MKQISILIGFVLLSQFSLAQKNKSINTGKNALAVQGYDVVSYFDGKATEGKATLTSDHDGAVYRFSSPENKKKFDKSPQMYIPQYGGWCAYAMGIDGSKVKIDPNTFKISDDRLYLFYNFKGNNTLIPWNKEEKSLRQEADKQWDMARK